MTGFPPFPWLAFGLTTAAVLGVAQQPSHPDRPIIPVIGTVAAVSGHVISVATRAGMEDVAVNGDSFEMLTNPNADPESGYVKKNLTVSVDADTIFDASAKKDLRPGRGVQMVGLDLKNGTIRATRLTIYEGKRPVRMGGEVRAGRSCR